MDNYGYIYLTTNCINNKMYIGQKKGEFNSNYLGSGLSLLMSVDKYGEDNFKVEVLVYTNNKSKLNELEIDYIKEYRNKFGRYGLYNIAVGGDGGDTGVDNRGSNNGMFGKLGKDNPLYGRKVSDKTRKKQSKAAIERFKKNKHPSLGIPLHKDHKEKLKDANLGTHWVYNSKTFESKRVSIIVVKELLDLGWELGRGKEFKQKASESKMGSKNGMFGRKQKPEVIEKNRQAHLGVKKGHMLEETKKKLSESLKGRTAWNKGKFWNKESNKWEIK